MAKKSQPVFIPGTNLEFPSANAAAKALNISAGNISQVLHGKRNTAGGYQFAYTSNRTIYVPQTGMTYETANQAAKALDVRRTKLKDVLSGKAHSVGGYNIIYADKTNLSAINVKESQAQIRQSKKREKRQTRRNTKQAKKIKKFKQAQEKFEARENRRIERIKLEKIAESTSKLVNAKSELSDYIKKVNDKLSEYYARHEYYIYYSSVAPDVLALQMVIGARAGLIGELSYFDESLSKFELKPDAELEEIDAMTARITNLLERLEHETNKKNGTFWNIQDAENQRNVWGLEFFKVPGRENELDEYVYLMWDILSVINQSQSPDYPELSSDLVFIAISDAMKGGGDPSKISEFLDNLKSWMDKGDKRTDEELDEIFALIHNGYSRPTGYSIWDEEGWDT